MISEIVTRNVPASATRSANKKSTSGSATGVLFVAEPSDNLGGGVDDACAAVDLRANPRLNARLAISPCPGWKRTFDVVVAAAALVVLSPVLVCIGVYIKCVSQGPIFYRQQRYGLGGRPFQVWKFRTIDASHRGNDHHEHVTDLISSNRPLTKRDHKLDVIRGGAWLRNYGIDELPQLINVLVGEMSLVGPRPDVVPFQRYESWHRRRFDVLPGITGLWQVRGKNRTTFSQMMQLDLVYIRRRSPWLDLAILCWTVPALLCD